MNTIQKNKLARIQRAFYNRVLAYYRKYGEIPPARETRKIFEDVHQIELLLS